MGLGYSRVEPENNIVRQRKLVFIYSVPPSGDSPWTWNTPSLLKMSSTDPENGNANEAGTSAPSSISTNNQQTTVGFSKLAQVNNRLCPTSAPRRRPGVLPTEVVFKEDQCGRFPCKRSQAQPLEPNEDLRNADLIIEDSEGSLSLPGVKQWQIFPGNNRFYCDGRMVTGPDRLSFYLSFGLLSLVFGLFAGVVLPFQESVVVTAGFVISTVFLYTLCASSMLYSALIDPGIVPRATKADVEMELTIHGSQRNPQGVQPFIRERINGIELTRRWCSTCLMYKPPRSTHCRVCNNCVDRFDHHCPFLGNCVGQRNYPSFFLFLVAINISGVFIMSVCIWDIYKECTKGSDLNESLSNWRVILTLITGFITLASFIPVFVLFCMHIELISADLTTNEDIKHTFISGNPFSRGSRMKNCFHVLCDPRTPSLINRRSPVTNEWIESLEYREPVYTALRKRFGRKPGNNDSSSSASNITQAAGQRKNSDDARLERAQKSFLFLHKRSDPRITKNETRDKDGGKDYKDKDKASTDAIFGYSRNGDPYLKRKDQRFKWNIFIEPKMLQDQLQSRDRPLTEGTVDKRNSPSPQWYIANFVGRKKVQRIEVWGKYEIDAGIRDSYNAWSTRERLGPSYLQHL